MFTKIVTISYLNEPISILNIDILDEFIDARINYDYQFVLGQRRSMMETKTIINYTPSISFSLQDSATLDEYIDGFCKLTTKYKKNTQIFVRDTNPGDYGYFIKNPDDMKILNNEMYSAKRDLYFKSYSLFLSLLWKPPATILVDKKTN